MEAERKMEPAEILKRAYARVVVPEADGTYTAEILEFPGCVADGQTAAEALSAVEEIAVDWLAATIEQGQNIPEPLDHSRYSGKLVVRECRRDLTSVRQWPLSAMALAEPIHRDLLG